jgi:hypothetical protein
LAKKKSRTFVRLRDDKDYTPSSRRSEGQRGQLEGHCLRHTLHGKSSMPPIYGSEIFLKFSVSYAMQLFSLGRPYPDGICQPVHSLIPP